MMRNTYTYATLAVSPAAFEEIRAKLQAAGYADQFQFSKHQDTPYLIDMHGIALTLEKPE
jgi:hypothetical protein